MVRLSAVSALFAALSGHVAAHPGEVHSAAQVKREIQARDAAAALGQRSLNTCSNSDASLKMKARAVERRALKVKELREKRGITAPSRKVKRTADEVVSWQNVNHNMTSSVSFDAFTPLEEVFSANTSCILAPEVTDGPYYVTGEFMRSNVIESQYSEGVPLFLEVQYVDVSNCQPIPAVAVDIWNANATGVYSGISVTGNYAADGYDSTYLRGVQLTDHDGVVQFETIFPGHYDGRATHTHLLAHTNATIEPNGTISVYDAPVTHIGQLFYPESLREEVEALAPYNTNTQAITLNADDMWSAVQASSSYDPFPHFVYLGDSIADGLFAWIQIGVNASADYTEDAYYNIAAYLDAEGGHINPNSAFHDGQPVAGGPAASAAPPRPTSA